MPPEGLDSDFISCHHPPLLGSSHFKVDYLRHCYLEFLCFLVETEEDDALIRLQAPSLGGKQRKLISMIEPKLPEISTYPMNLSQTYKTSTPDLSFNVVITSNA